MKVLVTGGTGFVGSHTVAALRRRGHDVRVLARRPERVGGVLAPLGGTEVEVAPGDMTDEGAVARALAGCDAVVHAAAEIAVAGGRGPAGQANVEGVRQVVGQAVTLGLDPIVYTSSYAVHLPTDEPVITPQTPLAEPLSAYGRAKRQGEEIVRAYGAQGAPVTTFVIGGVMGPQAPAVSDSFGAVVAALSSAMIVSDGGVATIDVRDLAEVLAASVEPGRGPRRYVAGGHFLSWQDWVAALSSAVGRDVPSARMPAEEMIALGRQLDELREHQHVDIPLSEEAAVIMTAGVPTDDSATLADFGVAWRPAEETLRDAVAWLVAEGHIPAEPTLRPPAAG
jgi:nucleoside-diphosphate-sugar epimerase